MGSRIGWPVLGESVGFGWPEYPKYCRYHMALDTVNAHTVVPSKYSVHRAVGRVEVIYK